MKIVIWGAGKIIEMKKNKRILIAEKGITFLLLQKMIKKNKFKKIKLINKII